jgi:hypothetical protein
VDSSSSSSQLRRLRVGVVAAADADDADARDVVDFDFPMTVARSLAGWLLPTITSQESSTLERERERVREVNIIFIGA